MTAKSCHIENQMTIGNEQKADCIIMILDIPLPWIMESIISLEKSKRQSLPTLKMGRGISLWVWFFFLENLDDSGNQR